MGLQTLLIFLGVGGSAAAHLKTSNGKDGRKDNLVLSECPGWRASGLQTRSAPRKDEKEAA